MKQGPLKPKIGDLLAWSSPDGLPVRAKSSSNQFSPYHTTINMDWDAIAAGARGEGASYEKKRKAQAKKRDEKEKKDKAAEKWKVTVTCHSAVVYLSTDSNGLSDPYMEVYVGDDNSWKRIGTTKVQEKTLSPAWNESFSATVDGLATDIKIKLFDKDKFGSDYIGTWKSFSHTSGGTKLDFHPKGNHKLITAHGHVTATWAKK